MLSSLARSLGLGSPVSENAESGIPGFLAVMAVWAPGQACSLNEFRMEGTIAVCLDMINKKEAGFFRFHSDCGQPDRICHRLATSTEASQLNRQPFVCWLSAIAADPDVATTIAFSLEELGMVDSATVQYGHLVTTIEGSLWTILLGCWVTTRHSWLPSRGQGGENQADLPAKKALDARSAQRYAVVSICRVIFGEVTSGVACRQRLFKDFYLLNFD